MCTKQYYCTYILYDTVHVRINFELLPACKDLFQNFNLIDSQVTFVSVIINATAMDCGNKTVMFYCLQQLGLGRSTDIALSIIITALVVAGLSAAIHVALHIWFYKPRVTQGNGGNSRDDEDHHYEDVNTEDRNQELKEPSINLKRNKAYPLRDIKCKK